MYKYKNKTGMTLTVVGVGTVDAGKIIESKCELHSPNLELVKNDQPKTDTEKTKTNKKEVTNAR